MRSALFFAAIFVLFFSFSLIAQPPGAAPAGAGDKNITVDNTKTRSIELERVKRDAEKPDRTKQDAPPPVNFQQVKEDFESIQRMQDDIIAAYSKGSAIDYGRISTDSAQLNQSAVRLESNLFPPPPPAPPEKRKEKKKPVEQTVAQPEQLLPTDLKSLIVEQDSCVGSFVTNPMFTNPQVVNPDNIAKAHADLLRLIKLSVILQQESDKLKK